MNEEINSNTEPAISDTEPAAEVTDLKPKKSSFWKFLIVFAAIILLVLAGYWAWNNRLSPEAKESREMQANYDRYFEYQKSFEEAMRSDTYGGKTPEETLQLFMGIIYKITLKTHYLTRSKLQSCVSSPVSGFQHLYAISTRSIFPDCSAVFNAT